MEEVIFFFDDIYPEHSIKAELGDNYYRVPRYDFKASSERLGEIFKSVMMPIVSDPSFDMRLYMNIVQRSAVGEIAKNVRLSDLDNLVEHFNKLFESKGTFKNRFRLNGVDYGFIPNLDKISNGEYMDIDSNITDVQNYHIVLGVMYRPITDTFKDKYKIEEYEPNDERFELMKELPLDIALSAVVFFYHLGNELLKALPYFLEEEMNKINTQNNTSSDKSGGGIRHSINLLKEMLPGLMQSVEKNFLKV